MGLPGPLVAISGPTASGKSALADLVAARLGTSVVSVDAMQVYRGMDIGTAKVPVAERAVPLEMVDVAEVTEDYSAAEFQRAGRLVIDGLLAEGRVPVLCGGTGLYLDALVDEMDFAPGHGGDERRRSLERLRDQIGPQALWEWLRDQDPASAEQIHPHNSRRVIRALEMAADGDSYAERRGRLKARPPHYETRFWAVSRDPAHLAQRIESRVDAMIGAGLAEEVRGLEERGLGEALSAKQAIGYKEMMGYLDGTCSMDEVRDAMIRATRRYAKRQRSWIRRDGRARMLDLDELTLDQAASLILEDLENTRP